MSANPKFSEWFTNVSGEKIMEWRGIVFISSIVLGLVLIIGLGAGLGIPAAEEVKEAEEEEAAKKAEEEAAQKAAAKALCPNGARGTSVLSGTCTGDKWTSNTCTLWYRYRTYQECPAGYEPYSVSNDGCLLGQGKRICMRTKEFDEWKKTDDGNKCTECQYLE